MRGKWEREEPGRESRDRYFASTSRRPPRLRNFSGDRGMLSLAISRAGTVPRFNKASVNAQNSIANSQLVSEKFAKFAEFFYGAILVSALLYASVRRAAISDTRNDFNNNRVSPWIPLVEQNRSAPSMPRRSFPVRSKRTENYSTTVRKNRFRARGRGRATELTNEISFRVVTRNLLIPFTLFSNTEFSLNPRILRNCSANRMLYRSQLGVFDRREV